MVATKSLNSTASIQDDFSSEEFLDQSQGSFPWLMTLAKPKHHGLFTTFEQSEAADWGHENPFTKYSHEIKSGDELDGFKIPNPKILVIRSGELLKMKDGKIEGKYMKGDKEEGFKVAQKHLVMLLGENNKPLHSIPFGWTIKSSVMQAQFSIKLQSFRRQFEDVFAKSRNEKGKPKRSERFHSLSVFNFQTASEMKGEGSNANNACVIKSFVEPTAENFESLFVGYDKDVKDMILDIYDSNEGFGNYSKQSEVKSEDDLIAEFYMELEKVDSEDSYRALEAKIKTLKVSAENLTMFTEALENVGRATGINF